MGILLGEAAGCGVIVSCSQVISTGFLVEVLCAVPEWVGIILVRVVLVAEGVVLVGLGAAFCSLPSGGGEAPPKRIPLTMTSAIAGREEIIIALFQRNSDYTSSLLHSLRAVFFSPIFGITKTNLGYLRYY